MLCVTITIITSISSALHILFPTHSLLRPVFIFYFDVKEQAGDWRMEDGDDVGGCQG